MNGGVLASLKICLSTDECALNASLVHSIVAQSFEPQGHVDLWKAVKSLDVIWDNHFGAWKFCQLVHKLLREGNPQFTVLGYRFVYILKDLGVYWHKASEVDAYAYYENYGYCVERYATLLANKIRFHARYPSCPGNLSLDKIDIMCSTQDESNDSNIFQFAERVLNYLEDVLSLQDAMFDFHPTTPDASPTCSSKIECRLLGLIPIIEESKNLYFLIVQTLQDLHSRLMEEMLCDHDDRFESIFPRMRNFFYKAQTLHILEGRVWIPDLPDAPPDFRVEDEVDGEVDDQPVFSPTRKFFSELNLDKFYPTEDINNNIELPEEEEEEEYFSDFSDFSQEDAREEKKRRKSSVVAALKAKVDALEQQVESLKLQNSKLEEENSNLRESAAAQLRRQTISDVWNQKIEEVPEIPVCQRPASEYCASTGNLAVLRNKTANKDAGDKAKKSQHRKSANFSLLRFWGSGKSGQV